MRVNKKFKGLDYNDNYGEIVLNTEAVVQKCYVKRVFLNILQNLQENTCTRVSFSIKLQASACSCIKKETLAQVFSCEFYEIFLNTFLYRTLPVAASANTLGFYHA